MENMLIYWKQVSLKKKEEQKENNKQKIVD